MGDILEIIFAIVAGFFWLFGSSLFKRREVDESSQPTSPQRRNRRESDSLSSEQEARQREIREAIRRKIEERRQQSDSESVQIPESEPQYQRQYTEPQEEVNEPFIYAESLEKEADESSFSWDVEKSTYEREMQERLQEIEATKRRAEALKKQAKQAKQVAQERSVADRRRNNEPEDVLSIGSVQTALKNPENVRAAFLYGEILGKPLGLRSTSQGGLES